MSHLRVVGETFPISPNPPSGKYYLGFDSADGHFKSQNSSGTVVDYSLTAGALPTSGGSMTGAFIETPVVLTDATTIAVDATLGNYFRVTLGGNRTLGNPTSPVDGQKLIFEIKQDGTGSRTLALGTSFALGSNITSTTLSTSAGARDFIGCVYNSVSSKFYVIAFVKGY